MGSVHSYFLSQHWDGWQSISTLRLNTLLCLYLGPINVVVYYETILPNLGVGFVLRCFQRLSLPNIATRQLHLVAKPVDQRFVQPSPLVLGPTLLKQSNACNR